MQRLSPSPLAVVAFVEDAFVPTGGQTVFNLSVAPQDADSLRVSVNGLIYESGVDYTLAGTTLTWLDALFDLGPTDKLAARYVRSPGFFDFVVDKFTPTAGQTAFALSSELADPDTIEVTVNGVVYERDADYTLGGTNLTWLDPFTLDGGDRVLAWYLGR